MFRLSWGTKLEGLEAYIPVKLRDHTGRWRLMFWWSFITLQALEAYVPVKLGYHTGRLEAYVP
eukprot:9865103-Karenia_brevis.AAC.1